MLPGQQKHIQRSGLQKAKALFLPFLSLLFPRDRMTKRGFSSTPSGAWYTTLHRLVFMHFLVWRPKQDSRRDRKGRKDIPPGVPSAQGMHCWGKGHWLPKQTWEAEPVGGESTSKTCDPQSLWVEFIPQKQKRRGTWSSLLNKSVYVCGGGEGHRTIPSGFPAGQVAVCSGSSISGRS